MKKIVVVPKDAEVIPSENGHAFIAGVLVKFTAFWMRRLIKVMGERPAVVAVFSLSCSEMPELLDKTVEEKPETAAPVEELTEIVELPAVKEAASAAASWNKTLTAPVKPSLKAAKKPLKKPLHPAKPGTGGAAS